LCKKWIRKKNLKNKKCFFDPGSVFWPWGVTPPPDHHWTIIQHENRDFGVFYRKCFFDPADRQADNFFSKTLLYEKENKIKIMNSMSNSRYFV
jgi:hypothetical protein